VVLKSETGDEKAPRFIREFPALFAQETKAGEVYAVCIPEL
jgi:hypothetical protein